MSITPIESVSLSNEFIVFFLGGWNVLSTDIILKTFIWLSSAHCNMVTQCLLNYWMNKNNVICKMMSANTDQSKQEIYAERLIVSS